MSTRTHHLVCGAALVAALLAAAFTAAATHPFGRSTAPSTPSTESAPAAADEEPGEGRDTREPVSHKPTVQAAFDRQSYRQGSSARLVFFDSAPNVTVHLYRVADAEGKLAARDVMRGTPVGAVTKRAFVAPGSSARLALGDWPSGLYFATISSPGGRFGYAPFVLAPKHLGQHRIAVVMPTQSWQAYNFHDDDGNGTSDTWYAGPTQHTARLARPFENRGVPPHYHYYDEPYLRWLAHTHRDVDVLSDAELNATTGAELARSYDLIVFSGHHEYVTTHEYDAVQHFRDRGGNLMFLSANNFFWKITISHDVMTRVAKWRDLGRPEAALIGVQYYANDLGQHRGAWTVGSAPAGSWIFKSAKVEPGSPFSNGGIEADDVTAASPHGVQVLAQIENLYGDGRNAQMTYYETKAGAKVFAAGAFSLACSVWQQPVAALMTNLLDHLSRP